MNSFGKSSGGGRRSAKREGAPLIALLTTLNGTHTCSLVDISATGARLRGRPVPAVGEDLVFTAERVKAFATVVWRTDAECGVRFEERLDAAELNQVRREAGMACMTKLSPEDQIALDDWVMGKAR